MIRLMPKRWKIFQTYVQIYHKQMHDWLLSRIDDPQLRPPQILAIVNWEDKYYKTMAKLGAPDDWMRPHVIDGRSGDLIREYRQLIVKTVDEWMSRMANSDTQNFIARDESAFDSDENGRFRTKTLSDMWRMLREQLEVAKSSERTDIVEGVVEAMFRALQSRQRMWEQLIDTELVKYKANPNLEGNAGFQDWLVAIANDQIACIDNQDGTDSYVTRFQNDIQALVSPDYIPKAQQQIDSLRDGYLDLSTHCLRTFASVIIAVDFRTLLPKFFTAMWYTEAGMEQAVNTFEDYLKDYTTVLYSDLLEIFINEISGEFLRAYLSAVHNKGIKFRRTDPYTEKIGDDVLTMFKFFDSSPYAEELKLTWRVVASFERLLSCPKAEAPGVYEQMKWEFWDLPMGWIETCLKCRDDYDRALLNAVKTRAASIEVPRGEGETIMGKVK